MVLKPLMKHDTVSVCKIYWKILVSTKVFTGQGNITNGCKRNFVKCAVNKNSVLR